MMTDILFQEIILVWKSDVQIEFRLTMSPRV